MRRDLQVNYTHKFAGTQSPQETAAETATLILSCHCYVKEIEFHVSVKEQVKSGLRLHSYHITIQEYSLIFH